MLSDLKGSLPIQDGHHILSVTPFLGLTSCQLTSTENIKLLSDIVFSRNLDPCGPSLDLADSVNRLRTEVFVWVYVSYICVLGPSPRLLGGFWWVAALRLATRVPKMMGSVSVGN